MPSKPVSSHRHQLKTSNKANPYDLRRKTDEGLKKTRLRSTSRWQRVRELYIGLHPMCEDPHDIHNRIRYEEAAAEVHHIIRLQDQPEFAFNTDNLAALCVECHAKISAKERKTGESCPEFFIKRSGSIKKMLGDVKYNKVYGF